MDRHLIGHIRDSRFHRPARATCSGLQQEAIARFTQAEGFSLGPMFAEIALYQCQLVISGQNARMWHFIFSFDAVPEDHDLAIAVLDEDGFHALEFPCRCKDGCWINLTTGRLIDVRPTHWEYWP